MGVEEQLEAGRMGGEEWLEGGWICREEWLDTRNMDGDRQP